MLSRSKVLAIESVIVMLVLVLFAFVVFIVIDAGTGAYDKILDNKDSAHSARVAYSYVSNKIKQNDRAGCIDVTQTSFGDTLKIDDGEYTTFIFYTDGTLYECLTKDGASPSVSAANKITDLGAVSFSRSGDMIYIACMCGCGDSCRSVEGTVGLRT